MKYQHTKKKKGLAVASRRRDAEFYRKCLHRAEKTRRQAVADCLGHATRTGSGDESAIQDAANSRAHPTDRYEEGAASTAEQRGNHEAVVGHFAEGYSERKGGRYTYRYHISVLSLT